PAAQALGVRQEPIEYEPPAKELEPEPAAEPLHAEGAPIVPLEETTSSPQNGEAMRGDWFHEGPDNASGARPAALETGRRRTPTPQLATKTWGRGAGSGPSADHRCRSSPRSPSPFWRSAATWRGRT